jgi:hypothetical protein
MEEWQIVRIIPFKEKEEVKPPVIPEGISKKHAKSQEYLKIFCAALGDLSALKYRHYNFQIIDEAIDFQVNSLKIDLTVMEQLDMRDELFDILEHFK